MATSSLSVLYTVALLISDRSLPQAVPATISGALFGLVHGDPIRIVGLAVTGVILAAAYERRRTLVAPMAAHFTNNLVVVTLGIVVHLAR